MSTVKKTTTKRDEEHQVRFYLLGQLLSAPLLQLNYNKYLNTFSLFFTAIRKKLKIKKVQKNK